MGLIPPFGPQKPPDPVPIEPAPPKVVGPDKVYLWRLEVLERAGWHRTTAELLASDRDIDLHRAVDLLAKCEPSTALRILI